MGIEVSTTSLQLPASAKLVALQAAVEQGTGFPAREQRLTFARKLPRGEEPMLAYGISERSGLTLSLGLLGGAQTVAFVMGKEAAWASIIHHHSLAWASTITA